MDTDVLIISYLSHVNYLMLRLWHITSDVANQHEHYYIAFI